MKQVMDQNSVEFLKKICENSTAQIRKFKLSEKKIVDKDKPGWKIAVTKIIQPSIWELI